MKIKRIFKRIVLVKWTLIVAWRLVSNRPHALHDVPQTVLRALSIASFDNEDEEIAELYQLVRQELRNRRLHNMNCRQLGIAKSFSRFAPKFGLMYNIGIVSN